MVDDNTRSNKNDQVDDLAKPLEKGIKGLKLIDDRESSKQSQNTRPAVEPQSSLQYAPVLEAGWRAVPQKHRDNANKTGAR